MPPLPSYITLGRTKNEDLEEVNELGNKSFETDTHTQLKELVKGKPVFDESHIEYLRGLLDNPRVEMTVAKDIEKGRVVGHAMWIRRSMDMTPEEAQAAAEAPPPSTSPPQQPPLPSKDVLTVADLEALGNQSMTEWNAFFSPPGIRCRAVGGIAVHPEYQGRGIGGALMREGFRRCDEDGVYCWVQTSMGSKDQYAAVGFREVGRMELDLDLFSEGHVVPENMRGSMTGGSEKWGNYVWTYMRRDPVSTRRVTSA